MFQSSAAHPDPELAGGEMLPWTARRAVEDHLHGTHQVDYPPAQGYLAQQSGVFVTIFTKSGQLRGCRGTIQAQRPDLIGETRAVAISSAFHDERFGKVKSEELQDLVFEVSVLHRPEAAAGPEDLDPATYGIIVRAEDGRQALMLPGVAGLNTPAQQFEATCRKAFIHPGESVQIQRFRVDKFKEK